MGEMSATQTRIEETLLTLKEAIILLGALRVTQSTAIPQTTPLAIPVGDGYQPINVGIHGYEGTAWEQPREVTIGQGAGVIVQKKSGWKRLKKGLRPSRAQVLMGRLE
ncbi:cytochrome B559 subunit alpha [Sesbania bispinosa]|nr:cytochrome B559 subunit alpha [Sesbania bispinosa]